MPDNCVFNLVCHGMMLFVAEKDHFMILMPEIKEHDFKYGQPELATGSPYASLKDLLPQAQPPVPVDYKLRVLEGKHGQADLGRYYQSLLMIERGKVRVVHQLKRIAIEIPRPDDIEFFRPITQPEPGSYMSADDEEILHRSGPDTFYEVVAFRYLNLPAGHNVTFRSYDRTVDLSITTTPDQAQNLCLYSQVVPDMSGMAMGHRTGINDLIHTKETHLHPTFCLSKVGNEGGTDPGASQYGVEPIQLQSLHELYGKRNIEGGCPPSGVCYCG